MHNDQIRPISQWVEGKNEEDFIWHVSVLDDTLGEILSERFSSPTAWDCKHLNTSMRLEPEEQKNVSLFEYMEPFFTAKEPYAGITLQFRTVTTHKTQGKYAVFPSVSLIANSLNRRLCSIDPDFALADPEALEQVISYTGIRRYRLSSSHYELEGAGITGYTGSLELKFYGPDALRRLSGVLFGFAEWSGVGIKTALGMGGCKVTLLEKTQGHSAK
ncbi:MAG: CRISPR system precrRNA processing endoribonuclease RAMP protein Cas6 [Clostridia bacterium]|nr:CRISPR system precrRNA processing endoribonuclease RAMP protein Cas6 [Clostridia bacterium]